MLTKATSAKKIIIIKSPKTNWKIACPFWKKTKTLSTSLIVINGPMNNNHNKYIIKKKDNRYQDNSE